MKRISLLIAIACILGGCSTTINVRVPVAGGVSTDSLAVLRLDRNELDGATIKANLRNNRAFSLTSVVVYPDSSYLFTVHKPLSWREKRSYSVPTDNIRSIEVRPRASKVSWVGAGFMVVGGVIMARGVGDEANLASALSNFYGGASIAISGLVIFLLSDLGPSHRATRYRFR